MVLLGVLGQFCTFLALNSFRIAYILGIWIFYVLLYLAFSDRKPPGVGRGRGRGREDGSSGRPAKGIGRGLDDGGARGMGGGRGRGGPGGKTGGSRGKAFPFPSLQNIYIYIYSK